MKGTLMLSLAGALSACQTTKTNFSNSYISRAQQEEQLSQCKTDVLLGRVGLKAFTFLPSALPKNAYVDAVEDCLYEKDDRWKKTKK